MPVAVAAADTRPRLARPGGGRKVVLAMSGGVDSSVAAALLRDEGYEVVGCFMRLGSEDEPEVTQQGDTCDPTQKGAHKQGCCSVNDAADARLVAAQLDVPLYVLNFRRDFGRIMNYFVAEYRAGRTPNPCVRCNDWLKFGKLHDYARSIDADFIASGHYARIRRAGSSRPRSSDPQRAGSPRPRSFCSQVIAAEDRARDEPARGVCLLRGIDTHKDQSYVLFGTPREQLEHMLLPVGEYDKPTIRRIAEELNLPTFDKPDSQEICFVPDQDYAGLIERRAAAAGEPGLRSGDILDAAGRVLGEHAGQERFTVGQRRGVGVALGYPIYVVDKDPVTNTVTVGPREALASIGCTASQTNWLLEPPHEWTRCEIKVRYNMQPVPGRVRKTGADGLEVRFDQPVDAVTPGQAVVCYLGDIVMGGGWIDAALKS